MEETAASKCSPLGHCSGHTSCHTVGTLKQPQGEVTRGGTEALVDGQQSTHTHEDKHHGNRCPSPSLELHGAAEETLSQNHSAESPANSRPAETTRDTCCSCAVLF